MESPLLLVHQFLEYSAAKFSAKTAIVHERRRASYADVDRWANRLANGLIRAGLKPGDRVVLLSENSIEYVAGFYGILKTGAIVASLNTDIKPDGLVAIFLELDPKAILVSSRFEKIARKAEEAVLGEVPIILLAGETPEGSEVKPDVAIDPASCAAIVYTSGSEGRPKGVMLSHANILANTRSIVEYLELTSDDIQMAVLPFFYVMGKSLLNTHISVGGTVVINNKFGYTAAVLKQMAEEGVTGFSGVPSTYAHLLFRSPLASYRDKLPRLRYCSQAGGHMPKHIKLELTKVLPAHTRLVVMYGATEASARLTYVPPERLESKIDSIGIPIAGVELSVLSADGKKQGPGEIGEIVARGDNIMLGYFRDEEGTRKVLDERGYRTGDLGYFDEDGYFFVTGRKDAQIKVGGRRVDPQHIEDTVIESGLAAECLVFGVPDALLGMRLAGLVVPVCRMADIVTEILKYCSEKLPRSEVPAALRLVDALPRTGSGKPDRAAAVAIFLEAEATGP